MSPGPPFLAEEAAGGGVVRATGEGRPCGHCQGHCVSPRNTQTPRGRWPGRRGPEQAQAGVLSRPAWPGGEGCRPWSSLGCRPATCRDQAALRRADFSHLSSTCPPSRHLTDMLNWGPRRADFIWGQNCPPNNAGAQNQGTQLWARGRTRRDTWAWEDSQGSLAARPPRPPLQGVACCGLLLHPSPAGRDSLHLWWTSQHSRPVSGD